MDKELIMQQETANDGQTVYLFYDDMAGMYLAFGLSAYYVTMVTNPVISYSTALSMPVALVSKNGVLSLRQTLQKVKHVQKDHYVFRMRTKVGEEGYRRWWQENRF